MFALDQRNHGGSPHSPVMTYDAMASDVAGFMVDRHISRAHLLGHSMGGKTAMRLAQRSPELVERLVVVDIAPTPPTLGSKASSVRSRESTWTPSKPGRRLGTRALRRNTGSPCTAVSSHQSAQGSGRSIRWKLNLEAIAQNYPALVGPLPEDQSFAGPTLFVRGGRSTHLRHRRGGVCTAAFYECLVCNHRRRGSLGACGSPGAVPSRGTGSFLTG